MVDVLPHTNPPRRSPSTQEGECPSRPTVSLEARPHRHPAQSDGLQHDRPEVRATLSGSLRNSGQPAARPLRLISHPSVIAVDAFMFLLKGENPYCFPPFTCLSRLLLLRQQVMIILVAPDWQVALRPNLPRAPSLSTDRLHSECRIAPPELETNML